ncbi:hypothetical protein ACFWUQ_27145 [Streptomyces sp. NPDC058662]|uniref:hypothetical protein n=1 Tax=Streptomyces sp. NPDC058662 TaxID=3346583 RepID=UPI0036527A03
MPARDLYTGSYHLLCRQAAERLAGATGGVVVLSAQHGFVTLDEPLFPYDLRKGQPGSATTELLAGQAAQLGILPGPRPVVALGAAAPTSRPSRSCARTPCSRSPGAEALGSSAPALPGWREPSSRSKCSAS